MKENNKKGLDGDVLAKLNTKENVFKNFKRSRLQASKSYIKNQKMMP